MISLSPRQGPSCDAVERQLRASKLFQGLSAPLLVELAATSVKKRFSRGEHLWRDGDQATHFVLIAAGLVKIVQRAADQTESIIGLFGPREAVGTVALLRRGRYPASAVAASEHVDVLKLDPAPVLTAMDTDPSAARAMNGALLEQTRALHEKISVMSAGAVPQRLATQLLTLAERFGDDHDDGTLSVPLVLSRTEVACLVGARVETTIRVLAGWQRAKVIEFSRAGISILQPEALRAVARGKD
ncbi:MAG: Crp/Fnr family transcriptional regulator [Polyangiaceae bacterium]|nr:Crp/Fnr family transcriptional regulator [Polyangiaceae bacterium]